MKIRSITFGAGLHERQPLATILGTLGRAARAAKAAYADAGYEVQTVRLATSPLPQLLATPGGHPDPLRRAQELESACQEAGIGFCALGAIPAARPEASLSLIDRLPEVIAGTTGIFASVQVAMADRAEGGLRGFVNLRAARRTAAAIRAIATSTPAGQGNLRFAALANCPPHIPFFPAGYYLPDADSRPTLAIALEAADLALGAFQGARSPAEAQLRLVRALERASEVISPIAAHVAGEYRMRFAGIDLSLAPTPGPAQSIGRAFELLTGGPFGGPATLSAAAFITDCLRRARVPRTGYSGLMLPVLEDDVLAAQAGPGYDVDSLLLYAAVCGLGLDTVPLPGDCTEAQLAGVIADMATLAVRLDKPLTARLLPIPGKGPGDEVDWDFFSIRKGTVLAIKPRQPGGLFAEADGVEFGA
ncbi:MAG TPA: DUF711 family protein [Chloroflexia bacterium]|nr:DUF711 family protein [Chloroflexia bacterium]